LRTTLRTFGYKADEDTFAIDCRWLSRHGLLVESRRECAVLQDHAARPRCDHRRSRFPRRAADRGLIPMFKQTILTTCIHVGIRYPRGTDIGQAIANWCWYGMLPGA
jgi:hypothetical protein